VESSAIGPLVLARLLVGGEKGATATDLKKALEPLLGHRWAGAALADRLARALDDLEADGLIVRTRKRKTDRGTLTPEGGRRALEFLGLDQRPARMTWDQVKKTAVAARALGLPTPRDQAARSFGGDPGFKAALLKARFDLPLDDFPSFDRAIDALAWTLLGFEPGPKFTVKAVKAALLGRALDGRRQVDPKADPKKEVAKLLARKVGARQSGKDELRLAAIRQWIDRTSDAPGPAPPAASAPAPIDLDTFAHRVREAARASRTGRFGDNKVFVVHVWRALGDDPAIAALGLDGFKQQLAAANHARRLDLSRADMVEAMDPGDVRDSEVTYLGARFHFVQI
jgi:DNA-binding PadR family transcriptional regulator